MPTTDFYISFKATRSLQPGFTSSPINILQAYHVGVTNVGDHQGCFQCKAIQRILITSSSIAMFDGVVVVVIVVIIAVFKYS